MSEITPHPDSGHAQLKVVATREELASRLRYASELEHSLLCMYLFAAYSLKNDVSEGGLTDAQASIVRQWRRRLMQAASNRMLNLAQISNILIGIGEAAHITRPIFPVPESTSSGYTGLTLEPFSQLTMERLAMYERLEAVIGIAETGKELYDAIALGFRCLPAEELFIDTAKMQVSSHFLDTAGKGPLIAVIDRASASAALDMISGASNDETSAEGSAQASVSETIGVEYAKASADALQAGLRFEPVRPVGKNPHLHLPVTKTPVDSDRTYIVDPRTSAVATLFNDIYDTMLLLLLQVFTHTEETDIKHEQLEQASLRLMNSVIRPLGEALTRMPAGNTVPGLCAGPSFGASSNGNTFELAQQPVVRAELDERFWQLATTATVLCVTPGWSSTEIQEATAALQDLTCQFAAVDGPTGVAAKVTELKRIEAEPGSSIQSAINGPYLVTNAERLKSWLGESMPTRPQMALCRCGESASKPFCDGTHARIDFSSQKDPKRVPDRRDTYVGTAVTVLDNRGICAHSGFCTDRLSTAFHAGQEPFVTPSGARMDEIIRAVRSCPSGALSYAIGRVEAREQVDQERPPTIEVSKDGPYRISGGITLKNGQGEDESRNTGVSREHYSLCRCGHSQNKPFCSGMHWYVNFHDPADFTQEQEITLFEWVGGLPALNRMTRIFYDKYVPQDPLLHPLFANMSPDHPERVAAWLGEVFKGPKSYSETYGGYERMISQHIGKGITEEKRVRWASLLCQSADEAGLPGDPEFRSAFVSYIEWGSRLAVENSTVGAHPPQHMPMPHWDWGTAGPPMSRVSALAPIVEEEKTALPAADEAIHFAQHIKPLFRAMDRQSMKWGFDLWAYNDVVKHAEGILQRLQNGSMPCDGAWPPEKVEVFQRWVASGMQE